VGVAYGLAFTCVSMFGSQIVAGDIAGNLWWFECLLDDPESAASVKSGFKVT